MKRLASLVLVLLVAPTAACAFFGKADALNPRYFDPGASENRASKAPPPDDATRPAVRLGRVVASEHLKERLVYRETNEEIGFYEDRRWTEQPEAYLRRSLARSLFEDAGLRQVVSGAGPTLEAEMTAFEEVRGPKPFVRVSITVVLHDDEVSRLRHTFTVEKPLDGAQAPDQIVQALSAVLRQVTEEIASTAATRLAAVKDAAASADKQAATDAAAHAAPTHKP